MLNTFVAGQEGWLFKSKEEREAEKKKKRVEEVKEHIARCLDWFDKNIVRKNSDAMVDLARRADVVQRQFRQTKPISSTMSTADMTILSGWPRADVFCAPLEHATKLAAAMKSIINKGFAFESDHNDSAGDLWWDFVEKSLRPLVSAKAYTIHFGADGFVVVPVYIDDRHYAGKSEFTLDGTTAGGYTKDNFIKCAISHAPTMRRTIETFIDMRQDLVRLGDEYLRLATEDREDYTDHIFDEITTGIVTCAKATYKAYKDSIILAEKMLKHWYR